MAEPITFAALVVAAVSPLYMILKRHYDIQNTNYESRLNLARELKNACEQWSSLLDATFDNAVVLLNKRGPDAARREVERQQLDFLALDYDSLTEESATLKGLRKDRQFVAFAGACARFYDSAIEVKRIAYDTFTDEGKARTLRKDGFASVARLWKQQVEDRLNEVRSEFRKVEGIGQS